MPAAFAVFGQSGGTGSPGHTWMYSMSGDTQSCHCLWLILVANLLHSIWGHAAGPGHIRTVLSWLPDTMRCPSGLNATLVTG